MLSLKSNALSHCNSWHREPRLHNHDPGQALVVVLNLSQQLIVLVLHNPNLCIMGSMQLFDPFPQGAHLQMGKPSLEALHDQVSS